MKPETGYTAIELIVAAGVAVLLIAIAFPLYRDYQQDAKDAAVLAHLAELQEPLVTFTRTHEPLPVCQDYSSSVSLPTLEDAHVELMLTFSPVDAMDATRGYRASVILSADPALDMRAAREIYDIMKQRGQVGPGEVLTDSIIAYEIYLSPVDDPFCDSVSMTPAMASVGTSTGPAAGGSGTTSPPASAAASAPHISFDFSTMQDVVEFGQSGTGAVITNGQLQTGGDMRALAAEFNVIGGPQVATSGIHGATFLSYGVPGNENEFYVWKPNDLTVRIHGTEYATGIDTTSDSETHRYSVLWDSATGKLQVLVDGVVRFEKDNVGQGYAIPGGGVLALAQDQDRFQIEDGTQGANHGFAPQDAFHGQIFSAAMSTRVPDASALARAPLASVVDKNSGLVTNIQMTAGTPVDATGNHQLTTVGDVVSRTVSVDTGVAVPNPGATLKVRVSVNPVGQDTLIDLKLVGLLGGTVVTDSLGNQGSGGSVSILGWDLGEITAQLPAGVSENMNIGVIATVRGLRGDIATTAVHKPLVLDPTRAVPQPAS